MNYSYSSKNIESGGGSGGGSAIFEKTFTPASFSLNAGNYELTINQVEHGFNPQFVVQVEELVGSYYQEVDVVLQNQNGNLTIIVGDDSRFTGRVLIKE